MPRRSAYFSAPLLLSNEWVRQRNPQPPEWAQFPQRPGYRGWIFPCQSIRSAQQRILGEAAKLEFRVDAYNLFQPFETSINTIVNDIKASGFGRASRLWRLVP